MEFKLENKNNILNFQKSRSIIYTNKSRQTDFSDKTTNFTVSDKDTYLYCNSSSIMTVTLPTPSLNLNRNLIFVNRTDNLVNSSTNITKISSGALITSTVLLEGQKGYWCQLVSDGTKWINIISKNISIQVLFLL